MRGEVARDFGRFISGGIGGCDGGGNAEGEELSAGDVVLDIDEFAVVAYGLAGHR